MSEHLVQNEWSKWSWKVICKVILAVYCFTQLIFVSLNGEFPIMGEKKCLRSELFKVCTIKIVHILATCGRINLRGVEHCIQHWFVICLFSQKVFDCSELSGCGSAEVTCTVCKEHHTQWQQCHLCIRLYCINAISVLSGYQCTVFTGILF